ncbi:MAG TPA: hypothetical protein VE549_10660 [Myxococcaceae bacterium]|jgi:hypothetical protein|nr:hypothetical protein [Myxococcaceae bacterium]
MNAKRYGVAKIVAVAGVLVGLVAWAATNPLVISAGVSEGTLSISTTQAMPKGWFSSRNTFDRTKTDLRVTYTIGATACSAEATGSLSSLTVGQFSPLQNSNGNDIGYFWNTVVDVAAYAEHYTIHVHCDGTQHVHGCNVARPVTVTVQAFDKSGVPHTYVDDSGVTQLALVTVDAGAIAPILDGTIFETCEVDCGIGQCVSACEHACNALPKKDQQKCNNDCQCQCKLQKHAEIPVCHKNAPEQCAP